MGNYVQAYRSQQANINVRILAALGVVAGLGAASIPVASYAADVSGNVEIETEIEPSLAMRIHSNADQTCSGDPEVCTDTYGFVGYNPASAQGSGDTAATASGVASQATGLTLSSNQADSTTLYSNISVRSNTGRFKVEVQDSDDDTAMRNESGSTTAGQFIPAGVTTTTENGDTVITPSVAGWALKGGDVANWTAITASTGTPITIKASGTNATAALAYSDNITVNYGVASGLTKTDTYFDTITYTATALDSATPGA
ncbi:hypothetical protein IJH02_00365 [Candidatus Saccharibacteria bacterium]|nr:hypothetical protein [Candidatus Saccharibacteria bacterium]